MKIDEKDIFFLLTNKCNLNCFACGYGCEDKEHNWFISEEQFVSTLQKLKGTNIEGCTRYVINLTGGDPMLHKDWKKFALLAAEMFPDSTCFLSTSGPLLATLDDDILMECHNKNVRFGITLYPSMKLLPMYQAIEEKFKRLGILDYLSWNPIRIIFGKPFIEENKNGKDCFQYNFPKIDYCFIYKDNLYNCQNLFYQDMKNDKISTSYNVSNITNNCDLKFPGTKKDCQNCKLTFHENILWHFDSQIPKDCLFTPLRELFLHDYNSYYLLQHDCKEHLEVLNNDFFKRHYKEKLLHPIAKTRFFSGKLDVFIPYNNYINKEMSDLLKAQNNLDNCNIYLVSYTDDININTKVYDDFYIPQKNIFFLKANNYLDSIHKFLNNSYLNNKYCLDIADFNCLKDKNFLTNQGEILNETIGDSI